MMWYREWKAYQLRDSGENKALARRNWPENCNPAVYDDHFQEVSCIRWDDLLCHLCFRDGERETVGPYHPVVERVSEAERSGHGVILIGPHREETGYLTPWEGEETDIDPVWDAWLCIPGGSVEKLIANGVSMEYGRRMIRKHTRNT